MSPCHWKHSHGISQNCPHLTFTRMHRVHWHRWERASELVPGGQWRCRSFSGPLAGIKSLHALHLPHSEREDHVQSKQSLAPRRSKRGPCVWNEVAPFFMGQCYLRNLTLWFLVSGRVTKQGRTLGREAKLKPFWRSQSGAPLVLQSSNLIGLMGWRFWVTRLWDDLQAWKCWTYEDRKSHWMVFVWGLRRYIDFLVDLPFWVKYWIYFLADMAEEIIIIIITLFIKHL